MIGQLGAVHNAVGGREGNNRRKRSRLLTAKGLWVSRVVVRLCFSVETSSAGKMIARIYKDLLFSQLR